MQLMGLIGGMSWQSTIEYYRLINQTVAERLGDHHSARMLLYSVDFDPIEQAQHAGDWDKTADLLVEAAVALRRAGAEFLLICANTMHKVADAAERAAELPLLHIVDPTAKAIQAAGLRRIGLLGTRFTMEQDFYRRRLTERFQLDVLIPDDDERQEVHRVLYEELCHGRILEASRKRYQQIIDNLARRGAEGVILGCTEIPLLISQKDTSVPVFDTTCLHAEAAVDWALGAAPSQAQRG